MEIMQCEECDVDLQEDRSGICDACAELLKKAASGRCAACGGDLGKEGYANLCDDCHDGACRAQGIFDTQEEAAKAFLIGHREPTIIMED